MLNCPSCVYADFEKDKCTRLLNRLPHICPYSEERKPRNHFEMVKAMSMEEMAVWLDLVRNNKDYPIYATDWTEWLKEEVGE